MQKLILALILVASQSAHAYPVRTVTLECAGADAQRSAALTIVKTFNAETGKLSFDLKMSVQGVFDGQPGALSGQATINADSTKVSANSPTYDVSDKAGKNKISVHTVGGSLKTPDSEMPGLMVSTQVETGDAISPYLIMKGVVGNLSEDEGRTMNVTVISSNGNGRTPLGNGDLACTYVIHD